jgi:hypothetical protein
MIAQDVKLLCPAELRDTCMLLFHHMQKAFSGISFGGPRGPVRISTKKAQDGASNASSSGSPRMRRSRSNASDASGSLGRASTGMAATAAAAGATGGSGLRRHGSSELLGQAGAGGGDAAAGASVATQLEETLMLQRILKENAAAAAAAAAAAEHKGRSSRRRTKELPAGSAAGAASGGGQAGMGHAAVAARAVKAGGAGSEDEHTESPRSGVQSDASQRTDESGASAGAAAGPRQTQQPGVPPAEQQLLEYEIEFVQVQVGAWRVCVCVGLACIPVLCRSQQARPAAAAPALPAAAAAMPRPAGCATQQVNLVSDFARGSLVLGTNSALLTGHLNTARMERSVSFKMDQVQAHVVCSEMDPQRGPLWLQIANGKLSTPPGAEGIMRQVLLPFKVRAKARVG